MHRHFPHYSGGIKVLYLKFGFLSLLCA
uniref:Uncharacterized protein n=1 Tax=Anguilla anguilla TaxID=7936 RepID=A0A0E9PFN3_ANGAN